MIGKGGGPAFDLRQEALEVRFLGRPRAACHPWRKMVSLAHYPTSQFLIPRPERHSEHTLREVSEDKHLL